MMKLLHLNGFFQDKFTGTTGILQGPKNSAVGKCPKFLMSGNHKLIEDWRAEQSLQRTKDRRPDILDS